MNVTLYRALRRERELLDLVEEFSAKTQRLEERLAHAQAEIDSKQALIDDLVAANRPEEEQNVG